MRPCCSCAHVVSSSRFRSEEKLLSNSNTSEVYFSLRMWKGLRVTKTGPPQCESCDWLSGRHGSQTNKMVRCVTARKRASNTSTDAGTNRIWIFVLLYVVLPHLLRSHVLQGGRRRGESLGGPRSLCPAFVLLFLLFFLKLSLAQDLGRSHSCSADRSTSEMPTSTPVMIEVSESLLRGGWCSPEGRERER